MKKGQFQKKLPMAFSLPKKTQPPGGGSMTPQKKKTPEKQNSQKKPLQSDSRKPSSEQKPITVDLDQQNALPVPRKQETAPEKKNPTTSIFDQQPSKLDSLLTNTLEKNVPAPTQSISKTKPIKKTLKKMKEKHQDDQIELQVDQSQEDFKNYNDGLFEDQVEVKRDGADQSQEQQEDQNEYEQQGIDDRNQSQMSMVQEDVLLDQQTIKFNKKFEYPDKSMRKDIFNAQFNSDKNLKASLKFIRDDSVESSISHIYYSILNHFNLVSNQSTIRTFDDVLKNLFPASGRIKQIDINQLIQLTEQMVQQHLPIITPHAYTQMVRKSFYGFLVGQFDRTRQEEDDYQLLYEMQESMQQTSINEYLKTLRPKIPANPSSNNQPSNNQPPPSPSPSNKNQPPANNQSKTQPPANNQSKTQPPANNQSKTQPPSNNQSKTQPPANTSQPPANTSQNDKAFSKYLESCQFTIAEYKEMQKGFNIKYQNMRQPQSIEIHQNKISQLQNQVLNDLNMINNDLIHQFPKMDQYGKNLLSDLTRIVYTNKQQIRFIKNLIQEIKKEKSKSNIAIMLQNRLKRQAPTQTEPTPGTKKIHLNSEKIQSTTSTEKPQAPASSEKIQIPKNVLNQGKVTQQDKKQFQKVESIPQCLQKNSSFKFAQLAIKLMDPQEFSLKYLDIALAKSTWETDGLLADLMSQCLATNMKSVAKFGIVEFVGQFLFGKSRSYIDHPGLHIQARDFIKMFGKLIHQQQPASEISTPKQTQTYNLNTWFNRTQICPECAKTIGDKKEKDMRLCASCNAIFSKAAMDILSDLKQNIMVNYKFNGEMTKKPFVQVNEQISQIEDLDEKQSFIFNYRKAQVQVKEQTLYFQKFVGNLKYTVSDVLEALNLLVSIFYGNAAEYKSYSFKLIEASANQVLYYGDVKNASRKVIHNFNLFQWIFESTERGNSYNCNKWKFMADDTERDLNLKWISMNMSQHHNSVYCKLFKQDNIKSASDESIYERDVNKFFWKHPAANFGGRRLFVQLAELTLGYLCGALEKQSTWKFSKVEQLAEPVRVTGKSTPKKALM